MDTLISAVIGDIALVLAISACFSALARRCGQPGVVGQIIAGILLTAGLIDQRLFTVLVLMALITTLATAPLLDLIRLPAARPASEEAAAWTPNT
jgi:Kef-type K+ transport system membrane component KefB